MLIELAKSRTPESLSKGDNFKKLLELHVTPYEALRVNAEELSSIKNINKAKGVALDWLGVLLGIKRPKYTLLDDGIDQYFKYSFNAVVGDEYVFGKTTKPYRFDERAYITMIDADYRVILKAFAELSNFSGSRSEYNSFLMAVFGMSAIIYPDTKGDLLFIIENTKNLNINKALFEAIIPRLPTIKNTFAYSHERVFSYTFANLTGSSYNFDGLSKSSYIF